MKSCMTVVLERLADVDGPFATEPYELPWAAEARFFVHTLTLTGNAPGLEFRTQISADGLHWCDLDESSHQITEPGLISWSVGAFGQWLRLQGQPSVPSTTATVRIYLVGKG